MNEALRQRVLRLLVKDVLVGPDKITIPHSIPVRHNASSGTHDSPETDSEGEIPSDCQLRWRSHLACMPGTTWPVNGHPPVSSRDYPPAPVLMPANLFRHVNGCDARLPDPRLTLNPWMSR